MASGSAAGAVLVDATGGRDATAGVLLTRRNIYILPTAHGLTYAAVVVVTLLGATNYNNSLAFMLSFLMAGLGLTSMLHTYRNLAGLRVQVRAGEPVSAGGNGVFTVALDNTPGPLRPGLELRQGRAARRRPRRRAETRTAVGLAVLANDVAQARLTVPATRRGWLWPQRMSICTRVPLGLFRAWATLRSDTPCLVYPRAAGSQPMPPPDSGGERSTRTRHGDEDFAGLRDYRPGDSPRRIHWRAARGQLPPVKEFQSSSGDERLFRLRDVTAGNVEDRLCQLEAWIHEAHRQDLRYGLELPEARLEPEAGAAHMHRCLRALALHDLDTAGPDA